MCDKEGSETTEFETPSIVGVILNWNNFEDTAETIESLQSLEYKKLELLLVDNGSTDGSVEKLEREFPSVKVLKLDQNRGFPGGNNPGVEWALDRGADYVWLLNNDVLFPQSEALEKLVDQMERKSELGLLSPLITHYPETHKVWFSQGWIDSRSGFAGHEIHRRSYIFPGVSGPPEREDELLGSAYAPLCCALVDADALRKVGTLDEKYFLYGSDVDFAIRLTNANYEIATDPRVKCYHKVSASSPSDRSPVISYYAARNQWLLRRDHEIGRSLVFFVVYLWWLGLQCGVRLLHGEIRNAVSLLYGVWDGVRQEVGHGRYP